MCNACGYFAIRSKTNEDIISTFSGFVSGTKFYLSEKKRHWHVWCPVCAADEYSLAGVSPDRFLSHASSLQKGCKPCRCGKNYRWTAAEREYLIKKLCNESGIEFSGWVDKRAAGRSTAKIKLECKDHGEFIAKVADFIHDENRCPSCAIPGFRYDIDGYVYVLRSDCGKYAKVGISNYPEDRIKILSRATPFGFSTERVLKTEARMAREIEKEAHSFFDSANMRGFDGATEWLEYEDAIVGYIEKRAM